MKRYELSLINKARELRSKGKTYREIRIEFGLNFPKATLAHWFEHVVLPLHYPEVVRKMNLHNLTKARTKAAATNKLKRERLLLSFKTKNLPLAQKITDPTTARLALAMLCLGEASKYAPHRSFSISSSDPRIIIIFLRLMRICFDTTLEKFRCTVQCRADQNIEELEKFWRNVTKIPQNQFYKSRIDSRTVGKPTKKTTYKGVLRVDYFDLTIQLELETLYNLVYNQLL